MLFALGSWFYWECVPSKSNWADATAGWAGQIRGTELMPTPFSRSSCGSCRYMPWCSSCSSYEVLWGSA